MDEASLDGWRYLACAVLLRAYEDAHSKNGRIAGKEAGLPKGATLAGDARAFLKGDGAQWLIALLEWDPDVLDRVLARLAPAE